MEFRSPMRRVTIWMSVGVVFAHLVACKKPASDSTDNAAITEAKASPDPEASPTVTPDSIGNVAIVLPSEPDAIFTYVDQGLRSSLEASDDPQNSATALLSPGTVAITNGLRLGDDSMDDGNSSGDGTSGDGGGGGEGGGGQQIIGVATQYCNQEADPISSDPTKNVQKQIAGLAAALPPIHPDYAAGKLFCLLTYPAESPDTAPGSYAIARMFTCLTDGKLVYDGQAHSLVTEDLSTSACVPPGLRAQIAQGGPMSATISVTASKPAAFGASGWDMSLEITGPDISFKLLFKSSDDMVAVSGNMAPQAAPDKMVDAFSLLVDPVGGKLRYEGRFRREVLPNNPYIRHMRMIATGAVDSGGKFTSLATFSGAYSNAAKVDGGYQVSELDTVDGSTAKGFKAYGYRCGMDCGTLSAAVNLTEVVNPSNCYGGDGTCTDSGLPLTRDDQMGFFLNPLLPTQPMTSAEWFETTEPLSFDAVTLDERQ